MTLDYDGTGLWSKFRCAVAWLVLRALSRGAQYGRKSADCGYHVKAHGLRISFRLSLLIRAFLLEDSHRWCFDMRRTKKPKQILWSWKNGKYAGKWVKSLNL